MSRVRSKTMNSVNDRKAVSQELRRPPSNRKRNIDISGQRFGFWVALSLSNTKTRCGKSMWLCRCDCGTEKLVATNSLRTGNSVSCGCHKTNNLTGEKFGDMRVISPDHSRGRRAWLCECACGERCIMLSGELRSPRSPRCTHSLSEAIRMFASQQLRALVPFHTSVAV